MSGSPFAANSPDLFAGNRVLLRPLAPRHPPCALCSLTYPSTQHSAERMVFTLIVSLFTRRNSSSRRSSLCKDHRGIRRHPSGPTATRTVVIAPEEMGAGARGRRGREALTLSPLWLEL